MITRRRLLASAVVAPMVLRMKKRSSTTQPNIVLLVTDDARADEWQHMRNVQQKIGEKGCYLPNFVVSNPICAGSRISMLTGLYGHRTGVLQNAGAFVASQAFDDSTLPVWLQNTGYATGLFGKYLNGYRDDETYIPPGWSRWRCSGDQAYYNWTENDDGILISHGSDAEDFQPRAVTQWALDWINESLFVEQPFFAYVAPFAPHTASKYESRYSSWFASESDIVRRKRLRSLQTVDRFVKDLYSLLNSYGAGSSAYVIVVSDNGQMLGEHGVDSGKQVPYEEAVRVGAYVRGPGIAHGTVKTDQYANIDVAATVCAMAGVAPGLLQDGISWLRSLQSDITLPREEMLIQGMGQREDPRDWIGFRSNSIKYVEYDDGDRLLFDLASDPGELDNLSSETDLWSIEATLDGLRGS